MNNKNPFDVKGIAVTTPKGKALWCKSITPDTKFDKAGELSTSLVLDPNDKEVQAFLAPLEAMLEDAYQQTLESLGPVKAKAISRHEIAQVDTDKDGNDTGMIKIKLKLGKIEERKAEGKPHSIKTVDAKKATITHPPMVGNGSTIRCAGFAFPYYAAALKKVGVSIMWNSLQIIDLVQAGGGDEFGEEEGYAAGTESQTSFESVPF
jgi:hypothetical protein